MLYEARHDTDLQESSMPISQVGLGQSAARDGPGWEEALSSSSLRSRRLIDNILIQTYNVPGPFLFTVNYQFSWLDSLENQLDISSLRQILGY